MASSLQFDVKEAKIIENHPQWDISEDEDDGKDSNSDADDRYDDDESEFEYDED